MMVVFIAGLLVGIGAAFVVEMACILPWLEEHTDECDAYEDDGNFHS